MEIGLRYLFYAFGFAWAVHLGYLLTLSFRQQKIAAELASLKKTLAQQDTTQGTTQDTAQDTKAVKTDPTQKPQGGE